MPIVWFTLGAATVLTVQRHWRRLVWDLLARGDS